MYWDYLRVTYTVGQVVQEDEDDDALYRIDGETVEEMREICYLADLLDTGGSIEQTVRMRVAAADRNGGKLQVFC